MAEIGETEVTFKIDKLTTTNYGTWLNDARTGLSINKCLEAVEPGFGDKDLTPEQLIVDNAAKLFLQLSIDPDIMSNILNPKTAKSIWSSLQTLFTSSLSITKLLQSLFMVKLRPNEKIVTYIKRIHGIRTLLELVGQHFGRDMMKWIYLMGLPAEYDAVKNELERGDRNKITPEEVLGRLYRAERDLKNKIAQPTIAESNANMEPRNDDTGTRQSWRNQEKRQSSSVVESIFCGRMARVVGSKATATTHVFAVAN